MDLSLFTLESDFYAWSPSHVIPILLFVVFTGLICWYAYRYLTRPQQKKILLIATFIPLASILLSMAIRLKTGHFTLQEDLPIHICRFVAVLAPWIYWKERPLWTGISYFWVLAGTVNATITPDLYNDFPHWEHLCYFALHLGLIFLPVYYVIVMGHRIKHKDLVSALIAGNIFVIFSLVINKLLSANYMFTLHKPEASTLLDYLGPWPWYLLSVEILGIVIFYLIYLPFVISKKK